MRALVVVVIGLWSSQTFAEPVGELTRNARMLASWGHCAELRAIGARVRELDETYFQTVFSVDPAIRACRPRGSVSERADQSITGKSGGTALGLSTLGFVAGVVSLAGANLAEGGGGQRGLVLAGLAGITIGPSLGHIYAGEVWSTGLQIRLVSLASATVGTAIILFADASNAPAGGTFFIVGVVGLAVGTLVEIVDAPGAVRRQNLRRAQLVPMIGADSAGASLAGRF